MSLAAELRILDSPNRKELTKPTKPRFCQFCQAPPLGIPRDSHAVDGRLRPRGGRFEAG